MESLEKRSFKGLVGFLIALWLFIFVPVWSLQYWQGWLYFVAFSVAVIGITVYFLKRDPKLIESRLKAGPGAEKEQSQKIIQTIASVSFMLLLILPGLDVRFHWSSVPVLLVFLGDGLVLLGFFIISLVFKENSYTSGIIEVRKEQKVISTGPYRVIRHPMYAGALLFIFATPIALGSYWGLFPAISMFLIIVVRLLNEEKYLAKSLPGYTEYCRKVPNHLIPWIW